MFDNTKKCPYCAETIKSAALVCRFCDRNLTDGVSARSTDGPSPVRVLSPSALDRPDPAPHPLRRVLMGAAFAIALLLLFILLLTVRVAPPAQPHIVQVVGETTR